MTEDVYLTFKRILENRPTDLPEKMVDGYIGFFLETRTVCRKLQCIGNTASIMR